jgi:TRAP transporter TAXI family solute receptor
MGRDAVILPVCPEHVTTGGTTRRGFLAAALGSTAVLVAGRARAEEMNLLSLGTAAMSGVYYPVGRAICRIFNRQSGGPALRCSAESTPGSIYNLLKLDEGELDLALVQSDTQFQAYMGQGHWAGRPDRDLRSIASLHPELLTIVATEGSGVATVQDLKGKRLNPGALGSGGRATWGALEQASGWTAADRPILSELKPEVGLSALCGDQLDATVLLVGHPSPMVRRHLEACATRLVPVEGAMVDTLLSSRPYYRRGAIAASSYDLPADVPSFGVSATLVTSSRLGMDVGYAMAKALVTGIDELRRSHPSLAGLDPKQMVSDGLTAPLHPGAEKAYRELKLIS